jgi:methionyl aminopeptidase
MKNQMIKSKKEIAILREGGKILHEALWSARELALEGENREVASHELNDLAIKIIRKYGGKPSFLGYETGEDKDGPIKYPAALCISNNTEIVHGIPTDNKIIKKGDLLKLDLGVWYKNLCTDAALSVAIGEVDEVVSRLITVTKEGLKRGLKEIKIGNTIGDYGYVVDKYVTEQGFFTVKGLVGHGVGYEVHEPPQIPNFGKKGAGIKFKKGMVLALEPMVNQFSEEIQSGDDGFAFTTVDGGLAAHFEHTVVVRDKGCEILT